MSAFLPNSSLLQHRNVPFTSASRVRKIIDIIRTCSSGQQWIRSVDIAGARTQPAPRAGVAPGSCGLTLADLERTILIQPSAGPAPY